MVSLSLGLTMGLQGDFLPSFWRGPQQPIASARRVLLQSEHQSLLGLDGTVPQQEEVVEAHRKSRCIGVSRLAGQERPEVLRPHLEEPWGHLGIEKLLVVIDVVLQKLK